MQGYATITQKGQVYIPKSIRNKFGLKAYSKVNFEVAGEEIIIRPIKNVDAMLGFIKTAKKHTEQDYKRAIKSSLKAKFTSR